MRTILATLALASLLGPLGSGAAEPAERARVLSLAMLGRYREAAELAKGSDDPICKFYLAQTLLKDSVEMRSRGVTSFDPDRASRLAEEVLPYLKVNAEKVPECAYTLGKAYSFGLGVKSDNDLAFRWYMRSAKKGYSAALTRVGDCYAIGLGVAKDPKQAIAWYKKGSDAGDIFALVQLGDIYAAGGGVPQDSPKASTLYEKAARAGSVDGMMRCAGLAEIRKDKALENKDLKSTITFANSQMTWLRRAANAGDLHAPHTQGDMLRIGLLGAPPGYEKDVFAAYEKAAGSGIPASLLQLACCYLKGWGCTGDPSKADKLFREALTAAKRDGNNGAETIAHAILDAKTTEERTALVDDKLSWSMKPVIVAQSPLVDVPKGREIPTKNADNSKLILTDIVANSSDSGRYVTYEGRVRNTSDEPFELVRITITLEDRSGKLLATEPGSVFPYPLEPGEVGTFQIMAKSVDRFDHIKVDFSVVSGRSIPWKDRSGQNVHR